MLTVEDIYNKAREVAKKEGYFQDVDYIGNSGIKKHFEGKTEDGKRITFFTKEGEKIKGYSIPWLGKKSLPNRLRKLDGKEPKEEMHPEDALLQAHFAVIATYSENDIVKGWRSWGVVLKDQWDRKYLRWHEERGSNKINWAKRKISIENMEFKMYWNKELQEVEVESYLFEGRKPLTDIIPHINTWYYKDFFKELEKFSE